MKLNDAYPSKYLTAADLEGEDRVVKIKNVTLETLGQGAEAEDKLVLALHNEDKGFVCNKTNATTIAKVLGSDDTDDWLGKSITIGPREVQFGKDMVWSIRVTTPPPGKTARHTPTTPDDEADREADAQAARRNR